MTRRILLIDGHPDRRAEHFVHALTRAYWEGARSAGHEVESIIVSELDFPLLRTAEDFQDGEPTAVLRDCQRKIAWAEHIVILYPLWLGSTPALLKGFFEQVLRPGFAFAPAVGTRLPKKLLAGKSARIIITMGMPALFYRLYYRAHSLKTLERNVLMFCGIKPVRANILGMVESVDSAQRGRWLARIEALGRRGR